MTGTKPRKRSLASWLWPAVVACNLLGWPGTLLAHSAFEGVGSFYGGVLHPAGVPAHFLALLAAGLLAGQRGWDYTVKALRLFIFSCIGGLALVWGDVELPAVLPVLAGAAVLGVLMAVGSQVPPKAGLARVVCVGFLVAMDSAPDEPSAMARLAALAGTAIGASAMFIWIAAPVSTLSRPWQHIASVLQDPGWVRAHCWCWRWRPAVDLWSLPESCAGAGSPSLPGRPP